MKSTRRSGCRSWSARTHGSSGSSPTRSWTTRSCARWPRETSGPGEATPGRRPCPRRAAGVGAASLSRRRAGVCHAALHPHGVFRRARVARADRGAGHALRPLRLPANHGVAQAGGLAGEPQAGGAALARGRAAGAAEAAEARPALARGWLDRAPTRRATEPRLVIRLRLRPHCRRPAIADAGDRRRAHAGVPGDRRGAAAELAGRAGAPRRALRRARGSRAHPLGQRAGVRGEGGASLARASRGADALHRAGQPLGERLHRVLQRQAARRVPEPRALSTRCSKPRC